jgi:putative RNA 2'-phosphotransferase
MSINRLSRNLTKALRHTPEMYHLIIDKNGWASVQQIIDNTGATMEEIIEVVETNDKQRLVFNENRTKIRANQGHSIEVDLDLTPIQPPHTLFHGTAIQHVDSILKTGLDKRNRHHVHMSEETSTASTVGMRSGSVVILSINASLMYLDGYKFYRSGNGVWLTDHVPSKYIERIK